MLSVVLAWVLQAPRRWRRSTGGSHIREIGRSPSPRIRRRRRDDVILVDVRAGRLPQIHVRALNREQASDVEERAERTAGCAARGRRDRQRRARSGHRGDSGRRETTVFAIAVFMYVLCGRCGKRESGTLVPGSTRWTYCALFGSTGGEGTGAVRTSAAVPA